MHRLVPLPPMHGNLFFWVQLKEAWNTMGLNPGDYFHCWLKRSMGAYGVTCLSELQVRVPPQHSLPVPCGASKSNSMHRMAGQP